MKIAVALTARPSYAKIKPIVSALLARGVDVSLLACASSLLERYGRVVDVVRRDFPLLPVTECWSTYEGANLLTSAKETGALLSEAATALHRDRPDHVLVIADRHEVLAVAQAAAYMHVSLIHCQGGEKTGSIDDKVRDAITGLADIHFPATQLAALRVYSMTGSAHVHHVGCPSVDVAKQAQDEPPVTVEELGGAGAPIDLSQPFGVLLMHPVTSEADQAYAQIDTTLEGYYFAAPYLPIVALWPGQDAGADAISKRLREHQYRLHTVRNLPPNRFLRLLTQCAVLVGNSSAGIREASYLGVPVVNIGSRQFGRQRGPNVVDVPHDAEQIASAIQRQIAHGKYTSSGIYGRGDAGQRIADVLAGSDGGNGVVRGTTVRLQGVRGKSGQIVVRHH
jgi:UDP-hydrolysing UDP-N-acetyl-D-glucosamine 2-epimerase